MINDKQSRYVAGRDRDLLQRDTDAATLLTDSRDHEKYEGHELAP
jgi:hypothetical protein